MRKWFILILLGVFSLTFGVITVRSQSGDCTVRTEKARTVAIRVGPGTNRTVLTSLPAKKDFKVLGKAQASDKSLWWKLDRKEVAPKKSGNEAWVAQADVTTGGDCSKVADTAAPAVIAITKPQPTAVPGTQPQPTTPINTGKGKGIFIDLPAWQNQLPADMKADSLQTAKVVVYVQVNLTTVQAETYGNSKGETITVRRERVDYQVRAVLAATGAELGSQIFPGNEPPPFPNVILVSGTLNGSPPDLSVALPWLRGFL